MESNYSFTPKSGVGSKYPKYEDEECFGIDLRLQTNHLKEINLNWLIEAYKNCPEKNNFFNDFFDKLAGSDKLRLQIIEGKSTERIKASWKDEILQFKETRAKYLIYK